MCHFFVLSLEEIYTPMTTSSVFFVGLGCQGIWERLTRPTLICQVSTEADAVLNLEGADFLALNPKTSRKNLEDWISGSCFSLINLL